MFNSSEWRAALAVALIIVGGRLAMGPCPATGIAAMLIGLSALCAGNWSTTYKLHNGPPASDMHFELRPGCGDFFDGEDHSAPKDLHRMAAAEALGKRPEDVTPKERLFAKQVAFAKQYGGRGRVGNGGDA